MHPSRKFSIDEVGHRLVEALEKLKWKVKIETDIPREFKHYFASKRPGILEAFVFIEILLGTIEGDPNYVDVIFIFYADPNITGKGRNKISFGKKARANDAKIFKNFCQEVFESAGAVVKRIVSGILNETFVSIHKNNVLPLVKAFSNFYPSYFHIPHKYSPLLSSHSENIHHSSFLLPPIYYENSLLCS